eukprot:5000360-Amphidinium_carterae.1
MAIVSSRRIAVDEGVAANVWMSASWMNCETLLPQKALDVLCAIVGRPLCNHPSRSHDLLKLFLCETVLVDLLKRLLAEQL